MFDRLTHWWTARKDARRNALAFEREVVVVFDEIDIRVLGPAGEAMRIAWADIRCVMIETNDGGPWMADVWWHLAGGGAHLAYPQGATGDAALLQAMQQRLHGFDNAAVVAAMGSTRNARFVCWNAPDA